jgi:hypothetical protein
MNGSINNKYIYMEHENEVISISNTFKNLTTKEKTLVWLLIASGIFLPILGNLVIGILSVLK